MIKNYLIIAYRNILKSKWYSFINIFGLAIGMTCCLMILLYVNDELSYDKYHVNSDRIYRVTENMKIDGVGEESASMPFPVGEALLADFPEAIDASVRFFNFQAPTVTLEYGSTGEKRFSESRFFFTDPSLFKVFSYEIIKGDTKQPLADQSSIVITESTAKKYFGNIDPIGKMMTLEGTSEMIVTAVIKDLPKNSHFLFDAVASFNGVKSFYRGKIPESWYWNPCWTYILLKENVNPQQLEAQFHNFVQKYFPDMIKDRARILLQPLSDIHLTSNLDYEINANSDITYIYFFSAIAIFVLLIACINFMNLATARSASRSREVGMRKALGAERKQIIQQFFGESILLSFLAALLAFALTDLLLPSFNSFTMKELHLDYVENITYLIGFLTITLLVGIFSGIYPALYLSAFKPVKVLKGKSNSGNSSSLFRKVLVVGQFTISIFLIIGTWISFDQLDYLQNKKLGFNKDQIVVVQSVGSKPSQWYDTFRSEILRNPNVKNISGMEEIMGAKHQSDSYRPEGMSDEESYQIPRLIVFQEFASTFEIEMLYGRDFSLDFPADTAGAIIINEACAQKFGWSPEEAVGKTVTFVPLNIPQRVIGVAKNFNSTSLHEPIKPFILDLARNSFAKDYLITYLAIKVNGNQLAETISFLKSKWNEVVPKRDFEYFFLDDNITQMYATEVKMGKVFSLFSFLAIFIACLGLLALASFITEIRTKEIGIRKVLGASVPGIIKLLSGEFVKWIIIANVIAWPIAYLVMNKWLSGFAFRIEIDFSVFLSSGFIVLFISLLTVSFQAVKAAFTNPVVALRNE